MSSRNEGHHDEQTITTFTDADSWQRALYAFLADKERRSGSRRTVDGCARMLRHFFVTVGCPTDRVTGPELFAWAYGVRLSKQPSSVTIGARLACLSSFYHFLIRMNAVASNRATRSNARASRCHRRKGSRTTTFGNCFR